jgi:hypothetical protein
MLSFEGWALQYPEAARALAETCGGFPMLPADGTRDEDESAAQRAEADAQRAARLSIARQGAMSWRNNVGALATKTRHDCPQCRFRFEESRPPLRYGLANDSAALNKRVKSSDLILAIPRIIRPQDVGKKIAQLGAVECKRPGWKYTGNEREAAQLAFLSIVADLGGFATFSTGEVTL